MCPIGIECTTWGCTAPYRNISYAHDAITIGFKGFEKSGGAFIA